MEPAGRGRGRACAGSVQECCFFLCSVPSGPLFCTPPQAANRPNAPFLLCRPLLPNSQAPPPPPPPRSRVLQYTPSAPFWTRRQSPLSLPFAVSSRVQPTSCRPFHPPCPSQPLQLQIWGCEDSTPVDQGSKIVSSARGGVGDHPVGDGFSDTHAGSGPHPHHLHAGAQGRATPRQGQDFV